MNTGLEEDRSPITVMRPSSGFNPLIVLYIVHCSIKPVCFVKLFDSFFTWKLGNYRELAFSPNLFVLITEATSLAEVVTLSDSKSS